MTVADYQPFVERMITRYEGNYGWSRDDPGGPTKYGITCYDLAEYLGQQMDSMTRWAPIVAAMTLTTADDIYETKYATACAFNALGVGKDCVVMDFGVNSGPARSIKYAQIVTGVSVDGILGRITLDAINRYNPADFVNHFCNARLDFLRGLTNWSIFGNGWHARVEDLRAYSLNLISPPLKAPPFTYVEKLDRIPLAYAKAYNGGDVPNQQ
jgi:lysozyme family protein